MSEFICSFLKKPATQLQEMPYQNDLGAYLYASISQEAWALWRAEQIKIINEEKLSLRKSSDRDYLKTKMLQFLEIKDVFSSQ